jgi:uncharacterized protein
MRDHSHTNQILRGLEFNVAQLLKETTGATRSYDVYAEADVELDEDVALVSPITGHVKLLRTGPNILVNGELETTMEKTCGRCLTTFTTPVSVELEEMFYPVVDVLTGVALSAPQDVDEANRIDEHHILDLGEVVRQELLLESDGIRYCRPDCKGLCPTCGQDRNTGACDCEDEEIDVRWADLNELKNQLNED